MQTKSLAKEIYSALLSDRALAVPQGGLLSGKMLLGIRKTGVMEGCGGRFQLCSKSCLRGTYSAEVSAMVTSGVCVSISH